MSWQFTTIAPEADDLTGHRSGRLLVLGPVRTPEGALRWVCRCDCGTERPFHGNNVKLGNTRSCGCIRRERFRNPNAPDARLYKIWRGMLNRCGQRGGAVARDGWGGRGISVCAAWLEYEAFKSWAEANGYTDGLTIDREDNDGDYEPGNCHWTTKAVQARNTRRTVWVEFEGRQQKLLDLVERFNLPYPQTYNWVRRKGRRFSEALEALRSSAD